jgi:hypothetical protein
LRSNSDYEVSEAPTNEEEVTELGRRLFTDRLGPLTFYPTGCDYDEMDNDRRSSTSFAGGGDDPDRPAALVLRLQSTLLGCEWLLGQWAELRAILDRGQPWLSSDKLKAVRLLGKQPFDAIDDRDVALVFLASFVLKGDKGRWYWEILMEMNDQDTRRFRQNAADRQLNSLKPEDGAKARERLVGIIERATERLSMKAEAHRQRAELHAALAPDVLAFDDSPEGERLRRYELANGRALARSLELLQKHRRAANQIDRSVKTGTFAEFDIHQQTLAMTEENTTNEPTDVCEIATNEPTFAYQRERKVLKRSRIKNEDRRPTVAYENVTNEPTVTRENTTNELSADFEIATNEPTDTCENVTNEPTVGREIVSNGPLLAADVRLESLTYTKAQEQNSTIEPTLATVSGGSQVGEMDLARGQERSFSTGGRGAARAAGGWEEAQRELRPPETCMGCEEPQPELHPPEIGAGWKEAQAELRPPGNGSYPPVRGRAADTDDGDDSDFRDEIDRHKTSEWVRAALARMVALRAKRPRELNEEIQREAKEASSCRHSRREWHKNGRHADRRKQRGAGAKPGTTETDTARKVDDLAVLAKAGSGLTVRAGQA